MGVMKILRPNPDDSLKAAHAALLQTENRISELQIERAEKIEQAEGELYLADVANIDRELATLRSNAGVHRDRMDAMQAQRRQHAQARLEQEKAAAVAQIKKRLGRRRLAGGKLDEAVKTLSDAFAELIAEDAALYKGWPDLLMSASRLNYTRATVLGTLAARRQADLIRELAALAPCNFAAAIDEKNTELLAELEAAALPELPAEETAA